MLTEVSFAGTEMTCVTAAVPSSYTLRSTDEIVGCAPACWTARTSSTAKNRSAVLFPLIWVYVAYDVIHLLGPENQQAFKKSPEPASKLSKQAILFLNISSGLGPDACLEDVQTQRDRLSRPSRAHGPFCEVHGAGARALAVGRRDGVPFRQEEGHPLRPGPRLQAELHEALREGAASAGQQGQVRGHRLLPVLPARRPGEGEEGVHAQG